MVLWKGSRKSCHVLGQWLLFYIFLPHLRVLWENGQWPVPFCLVLQLLHFVLCHFIPLIHSGYLLPSPAKRLQDPLFAAAGFFAAAASPQRQSSCFSLTSQRCQVPGLWDSHAWAAPHPDQALASPLKCCPPSRKSCKYRGLWRTHVKRAQQKVRAERTGHVSLKLLWSLIAFPLFLPTL